jgi:hypothetical protein
MTALTGHGLQADLPAGWSGELYGRPPIQEAGPRLRPPPVVAPAVLHAASFVLPAQRGDFGGGAVELMGATDGFVVLFEYEPEAATKALFAARGVPGPLGPYDFGSHALQRRQGSQTGCQRFFNFQGRAFCLYVVLGSPAHARATLAPINALLRSVQVS